ncbi:hypothetical protein [Nocardioides sp.]|uniref:hypothetical protein n=1 Tax=Nocardioides sp. TaxID=35761 RepID=UPI0037849BE7
MTDAPLPTSTRQRRRWRRILAGSVMAGSLALTAACGVAAADPGSQFSGNGTSSSSSQSSGGGTTLSQGSATSSHATSQGS